QRAAARSIPSWLALRRIFAPLFELPDLLQKPVDGHYAYAEGLELADQFQVPFQVVARHQDVGSAPEGGLDERLASTTARTRSGPLSPALFPRGGDCRVNGCGAHVLSTGRSFRNALPDRSDCLVQALLPLRIRAPRGCFRSQG